MTWSQTYTGRAFDFLDLMKGRRVEIDIADIARSLAMQCRFAGHCRRHYSVAEHSCLVACIVFDNMSDDERRWDHPMVRAALMHDAAEAYLVDLPRPVKQLIGLEAYGAYEQLVSDAIAKRFDLDTSAVTTMTVKLADDIALAMEKRDIMNRSARDWAPLPTPIEHWKHPDEIMLAPYVTTEPVSPESWHDTFLGFLERCRI